MPASEARRTLDATHLGRVLAETRRGAKLTQRKLATRVCMKRQFISKLESGLATPSMASLVKLGVAMGVPASELLRRAEALATEMQRVSKEDVCQRRQQ